MDTTLEYVFTSMIILLELIFTQELVFRMNFEEVEENYFAYERYVKK